MNGPDAGRLPRDIETDHLVLHPWRVLELDEYARLLADPEVMRHLTHEYGPLSYEEAQQAHSRILQLWAQRGFGAFAAVEKGTGRWAGKIGLDHLDRWPGSDKIEVEWQLLPAFWGRGYATEGARAVIQWAFDDLRLDRLIAITVPYHTASRRVMEKCGLTYQGTMTVTDRRLHIPRDVVWYALDRASWETLQPPVRI
jgi:RimJ/RimL family protein N-acetyltransferase